jgi:DNA-binding response OmpR family regulator
MPQIINENLEADRYRVRTADSREKALAILSVQQPDVIVVDVNGKTLDLIDAIRDGDGLAGRVDPDTPLIVLTTRVDELHRIRLLDRGGDALICVVHPLDPIDQDLDRGVLTEHGRALPFDCFNFDRRPGEVFRRL